MHNKLLQPTAKNSAAEELFVRPGRWGHGGVLRSCLLPYTVSNAVVAEAKGKT
jgi:hypothetical protein